jgi:predicted DNA-binding transcriptional regulator AlpA
MAIKFITFPELAGYGITYSRKDLIDLQRRSQFPKARQLSPNKIAWIEDEVLAWLATRPIGQNYGGPDDDAPRRAPGRQTGSRVVDGRVIPPDVADAT